jgi:hypothetical protein
MLFRIQSSNNHITSDSHCIIFAFVGWSSSVGIATRYGLDVTGIESRWGKKTFHTGPDRLWCPPNFLHDRYAVISGVKAAEEWR